MSHLDPCGDIGLKVDDELFCWWLQEHLKANSVHFFFFPLKRWVYLPSILFLLMQVSAPPNEVDIQLAARASSHSLPRVLIGCYLDSLTLCGSEQR